MEIPFYASVVFNFTISISQIVFRLAIYHIVYCSMASISFFNVVTFDCFHSSHLASLTLGRKKKERSSYEFWFIDRKKLKTLVPINAGLRIVMR